MLSSDSNESLLSFLARTAPARLEVTHKWELEAALNNALRRLEPGCGEQFQLPTKILLEQGAEADGLRSSLEALEKADHLTRNGENIVEWAMGVLSSLSEEEVTPPLKVFLESYRPGERWTIPQRIYVRDLKPYYDELVRKAALSQARQDLSAKWEKEEKMRQAALAQKEALDRYTEGLNQKARKAEASSDSGGGSQ